MQSESLEMEKMYNTIEIRSIQEIKELFPNGVANELNWLLCSTSGIHGSYTSIEDAEYVIRGENPKVQPLLNGKTYITVLIIQPRLCVLKWGEVQVGMEDLNYLRKLVRSSLEFIEKSQEENV